MADSPSWNSPLWKSNPSEFIHLILSLPGSVPLFVVFFLFLWFFSSVCSSSVFCPSFSSVSFLISLHRFSGFPGMLVIWCMTHLQSRDSALIGSLKFKRMVVSSTFMRLKLRNRSSFVLLPFAHIPVFLSGISSPFRISRHACI